MNSRKALAQRVGPRGGSILSFSAIIHKEHLLACLPQKEALIIVIGDRREPPCSVSKAPFLMKVPKFHSKMLMEKTHTPPRASHLHFNVFRELGDKATFLIGKHQVTQSGPRRDAGGREARGEGGGKRERGEEEGTKREGREEGGGGRDSSSSLIPGLG